jgi:Cd2+/Zn2+-exporting ATPase
MKNQNILTMMVTTIQIVTNYVSNVFPAIISFVLLLIAIGFDNYLFKLFTGYVRMGWYIIAYIPVGFLLFSRKLLKAFRKGEIFSISDVYCNWTFSIGEFPEGVAVMLFFYAIGEIFQTRQFNVKNQHKILLDQRPDE